MLARLVLGHGVPPLVPGLLWRRRQIHFSDFSCFVQAHQYRKGSWRRTAGFVARAAGLGDAVTFPIVLLIEAQRLALAGEIGDFGFLSLCHAVLRIQVVEGRFGCLSAPGEFVPSLLAGRSEAQFWAVAAACA